MARRSGPGQRLEVLVARAGLRPVGGEVQRLDRAGDLVGLAAGERGAAGGEPVGDGRAVGIGEVARAVGLHLAVAGVDDGDLVHLDPLVARVEPQR
jgi:hypothetical protein